MGDAILEVLTGVTGLHDVHEKPSLLLAAGWRAKCIQHHCVHELPLCLTQGPELAALEEALDGDLGTLGSVSRLAAWYSDKST